MSVEPSRAEVPARLALRGKPWHPVFARIVVGFHMKTAIPQASSPLRWIGFRL